MDAIANVLSRLVLSRDVDPLTLLVVASLLFALAMLWSALLRTTRERVRMYCPFQKRMVTLAFRLAPNGQRTDVIRCSALRRRQSTTCGKPCLAPAAAR
jgi:hypothetical protein